MTIRHLHGCRYGLSPANHWHRESFNSLCGGEKKRLPMRTEPPVISLPMLALKRADLKPYKMFVKAECFEIYFRPRMVCVCVRVCVCHAQIDNRGRMMTVTVHGEEKLQREISHESLNKSLNKGTRPKTSQGLGLHVWSEKPSHKLFQATFASVQSAFCNLSKATYTKKKRKKSRGANYSCTL